MQDYQLSMTNPIWKILCKKCNVSNRMALCNLVNFYGTNSNIQMEYDKCNEKKCNMTKNNLINGLWQM